MATKVDYRYFRDPHSFSFYTEEPQGCDVCQMVGPGYSGSFRGPGDVHFVCEQCLGTGALQKRDVSTNEGDAKAVLEQLPRVRPDLSTQERDRVIADLTEELEYRTPSIRASQGFLWPAHCGDYCSFEKEAEQAEVAAMAANADAQGRAADEGRESGAGAAPMAGGTSQGAGTVNSGAQGGGAYLFKCLHCGERLTRSDRAW